MTIAFEKSRKGFGVSRIDTATRVYCGFFTVLITRNPIIERIMEMLKAYGVMKGTAEPQNNHAEMACADLDSGERQNVKNLAIVPHWTGGKRK